MTLCKLVRELRGEEPFAMLSGKHFPFASAPAHLARRTPQHQPPHREPEPEPWEDHGPWRLMTMESAGSDPSQTQFLDPRLHLFKLVPTGATGAKLQATFSGYVSNGDPQEGLMSFWRALKPNLKRVQANNRNLSIASLYNHATNKIPDTI